MSFFRKKRLFIILTGFIILVALIGFSLRDRDHLSTPEQFVKDTVGVAQSVIQAPVDFVTDIFSNVKDVKNTYKENQLLKEKISQQKSLIYESQEVKKENKELRKTLKKTESIRDFDPIQATVVSRTPENWVDQVTINKGEKDGIKANMAVITADGMVGKIKNASPFTSTVQLLTGFDQYNRIAATVSHKGKKNVFGLIEEYDADHKSLLFKIIDASDTDIKKGEEVVSSGMGGVFPKGLPIGTVKKVVADKSGLTQTALVEPDADLYDIDNVIVVDRALKDDDDKDQEENAS